MEIKNKKTYDVNSFYSRDSLTDEEFEGFLFSFLDNFFACNNGRFVGRNVAKIK
jgi:hypothetical protein